MRGASGPFGQVSRYASLAASARAHSRRPARNTAALMMASFAFFSSYAGPALLGLRLALPLRRRPRRVASCASTRGSSARRAPRPCRSRRSPRTPRRCRRATSARAVGRGSAAGTARGPPSPCRAAARGRSRRTRCRARSARGATAGQSRDEGEVLLGGAPRSRCALSRSWMILNALCSMTRARSSLSAGCACRARRSRRTASPSRSRCASRRAGCTRRGRGSSSSRRARARGWSSAMRVKRSVASAKRVVAVVDVRGLVGDLDPLVALRLVLEVALAGRRASFWRAARAGCASSGRSAARFSVSSSFFATTS